MPDYQISMTAAKIGAQVETPRPIAAPLSVIPPPPRPCASAAPAPSNATARRELAEQIEREQAAPPKRDRNDERETPPRTVPSWKFQLITMNEFRRRYFDDESRRPSKKTVEKWILYGTTEGAKLTAFLLDGGYYIQIIDAENFLKSCRVAAPRRAGSGADVNATARKSERDAARRVENARAVLRDAFKMQI